MYGTARAKPFESSVLSMSVISVRPGGALLGTARAAVRAAGAPQLYARVDLVRAIDGDGWWLMELELIEPALYLRMDPGAPRRFAEAFQAAAERAVHPIRR